MALLPYPEDQILDRLRFENPWWISGKIDEHYSNMDRRLYFDLFFSLIAEIKVRRATVLMGPRRVGKTVMMYHAIQELLTKNIDPLKVAFISIETPTYNNIGLEQLFSYCRKASGQKDAKGWYVFFDEIQYLKDWEVHLKSLVDSYPNTRFIVSGSAAAALKIKSNESGAGRFTNFMLPSLTFNEFLHLKKLDRLIIEKEISKTDDFFTSNNLNEINRHFLDYINFGGYPEVILSQEIQNNPSRYIRSDIIDKVLLRDLPALYGISDVQELNSLFTRIAYNSGNEISLDELSKNSGVNKATIKRYIEYLEAAFLIKRINKISNTPKKFQRVTQFKTYLTNPSLRSALFSPISPNDAVLGSMVETAVFAQWIHDESFVPYYARWQGGEVDLVCLSKKDLSVDWALEIKWSNQFFDQPKKLKSLLKFLKDNKMKSATVTTIDQSGIKKIDDITLQFVPTALYAYTVGKLTMDQKRGKNK